MIFFQASSQSSAFTWLLAHLLPCPIKFLTHHDCPGCGFQRAFVALIQGHFGESVHLYPATIPLIILLFSALFRRKLNFDRKGIFMSIQFVWCFFIVYGFYFWKLSKGY